MEVDLLTASICVSMALVSAAVVYLGSVFGMKEKTYDEAIEEQRKKAGLLDLVGETKSGNKSKSEKDKKSKKEKTDKEKDKKKAKNTHSKSGDKSKPVSNVPESGKHSKGKSSVEKKESVLSVNSSGETLIAAAAVSPNITTVSGSIGKNEKTSDHQIKVKLSTSSSLEESQIKQVAVSVGTGVTPIAVGSLTSPSITSSAHVVKTQTVNQSGLIVDSKNVTSGQSGLSTKKKGGQPEGPQAVNDFNDQQKKSEVRASSSSNQKTKSGKKMDNVEPAPASQSVPLGLSSIKQDGTKNATVKESKANQGKDSTSNVTASNESKKESTYVAVSMAAGAEGKSAKETKNKEAKEVKQAKDTRDGGKDVRSNQMKETVSIAQANGFSSVEETIKGEEVKADLASPGRRTKKQKNSGKFDNNSYNDFSFKQLVDHISLHSLDNEEIQLLINVLLSKQGDESNQWKKKHDPLDVIKEQLHEKEQEVATLSKNLQATRARMNELRLELEHEKSVHAMTKDKLVQQNTELNNLRNNIQQTCELQRMEVKALQGKLKEQESDLQARNIAIQRLKDENSCLKLAMQQFEAERANLESIPRLHNEIERLRNDRSQMERRQQAMQQQNEDLLRNIDKMSEQIKSLTSAKQNEEYSFQKKLKELQEQLQQHDVSKAALLEDYKSSVDKCNQFEQEKQIIERKSEEDINNLRERIRGLEREKERLQEASNSKASSDEEKADIINKLQEQISNLNNELKGSQEEFSRVNKDNSKMKEELEKLKKENEIKVNETLAQTKASYEEQLQKTTENAKAVQESVKANLNEILKVKQSLEEERAKLQKSLNRIVEGEDIINGLDSLVDELLQLRAKTNDNSRVEQLERELNVVKENLKLEKERLETAQAEAQKFKSALKETDRYLKELEQKSKDAFEQSSNATKECQRLQASVDKLEQDKSALESSISQVENLKDTIKDLQAKYDELQEKLDSEESREESSNSKENGQEEQNGKDEGKDDLQTNNDEKLKKKSPKWKKWVGKISP